MARMCTWPSLLQLLRPLVLCALQRAPRLPARPPARPPACPNQGAKRTVGASGDARRAHAARSGADAKQVIVEVCGRGAVASTRIGTYADRTACGRRAG